MTDQAGIVSFLSSPAAFGAPEDVEIIETHGAYVFLCGDVALKLKRAVTYDYMDLGTVGLRRAMLDRELALNAPFAPTIYRDVLPVTRTEQGFELGGVGKAVDWVLRMWRFPAENELDRIADRGALDDTLATALGDAVQAYHAIAPVIERPGAQLIADILDELERVFAEYSGAAGTHRVADWLTAAHDSWQHIRDLLDHRGRTGHVRRGHGDLHLANLVLIDGHPTPFDALEFDETLGTCDVLYDVAFLIMDLCHRDLRQQACRVLDAWLREARGAEDAGLAALPLFLSVRAAIRGMVLLQTDAARQRPGEAASEIAAYMDLACAALTRPPPMLVAVGGYSASGKSLLARSLAPAFGPLPGAVLLASDLERKAGLPKQRALNDAAYGADKRAAIYQKMLDRAAAILKTGHSALLDATFLDPDLRKRAEQTAADANVAFHGVWLNAPTKVLKDRIRSREPGASDATLAVLERQLAVPAGQITWHRLDASGAPEAVCRAARGILPTIDPAGMPAARGTS